MFPHLLPQVFVLLFFWYLLIHMFPYLLPQVFVPRTWIFLRVKYTRTAPSSSGSSPENLNIYIYFFLFFSFLNIYIYFFLSWIFIYIFFLNIYIYFFLNIYAYFFPQVFVSRTWIILRVKSCVFCPNSRKRLPGACNWFLHFMFFSYFVPVSFHCVFYFCWIAINCFIETIYCNWTKMKYTMKWNGNKIRKRHEK